MSTGSMDAAVDPNNLSNKVFEHPVAQNCLLNMGLTSENVAEKFGITRTQ